MRRLAGALAVIGAAAAVAVPAAPADAPVHAAGLKRCGTITFSGTRTKIVVIRRTSCRTAIRIARRYDRLQSTGSWRCALARQGSPRYHGYRVGFSCGAGGKSGDLKKWPHAFFGAV